MTWAQYVRCEGFHYHCVRTFIRFILPMEGLGQAAGLLVPTLLAGVLNGVVERVSSRENDKGWPQAWLLAVKSHGGMEESGKSLRHGLWHVPANTTFGEPGQYQWTSQETTGQVRSLPSRPA